MNDSLIHSNKQTNERQRQTMKTFEQNFSDALAINGRVQKMLMTKGISALSGISISKGESEGEFFATGRGKTVKVSVTFDDSARVQ